MDAYLRRKGIDSSVADVVLERLEKTSLLGDREFALFWTSNRQQFSPRGDRALRYELSQRGVARENIEQAMVTLPTEIERARLAAAKKLASLSRGDPELIRTRLTAFLGRRGFGYTVCRQVVQELTDLDRVDE